MSALARRGFTLVELLIALVLLGMVSGAIYQVLANHQRVYQAQTQQIDLQQNLRAAATILPADFRELDAADSDITGPLTATAITIRAMRKLGFLCVAPTLPAGLGNISMVVRATPMYGRNLPFALGDSVLLFYEGNPATRSDDVWLKAQIKVFGPGTCNLDPNPATPGYAVQMAPQWLNPGQNVAGAITQGSPIRGFETIKYQLYQAADGNWYLGYQNLSQNSGIQPLIGPLAGSSGLEFDYFDSTGVTVATQPTQVGVIEIHLREQTAQPVRSGGAQGAIAYKVDSITTRVALRNNPRCGPCN